MKRRTRAKPAGDQRIGPDAWVRAGLSALAREGIEAVRVEPLAETLGVTKGSFYWHFKDRAALHSAMLESWREATTREVIKRVEAEHTDPKLRLQHLVELTTVNPKVARLETAIRSWAQHDSIVAKAVLGIDDQRISYVTAILCEIGIKPEAAAVRAKILYLTLVGSFFAAQSERLQTDPALWREITRLIT